VISRGSAANHFKISLIATEKMSANVFPSWRSAKNLFTTQNFLSSRQNRNFALAVIRQNDTVYKCPDWFSYRRLYVVKAKIELQLKKRMFQSNVSTNMVGENKTKRLIVNEML
jgi:hypothetical protein